jgi:ribonuclease HI
MLHVTIYSDASFNDKANRGGWATYIKTAEGDHLFSGNCSTDVVSSNQAEMYAMYCGLLKAVELFGDRLTSVSFVGDSQSALRTFAAWKDATGVDGESKIREKVRALLEARPEMKIQVTWRKGRHKRPSGTKVSAHISAICDQVAYMAMKEEE